MHARVAFFRQRSGTFEQVVEAVEAPGGLLEIFRERPGFQSYELIETGAGLVSVSHWDSHEQADAAQRDSAEFVADRIAHLIKLVQSDTGEVILSAAATAATP
jgi:heme-degrading monooxygenase HmoA